MNDDSDPSLDDGLSLDGYRPRDFVLGLDAFGLAGSPTWVAPELTDTPGSRAATISRWTGLFGAQYQHAAALALNQALVNRAELTAIGKPSELVRRLLEKGLLPTSDDERNDFRRHDKKVRDFMKGWRPARVDDLAILRLTTGDWTLYPGPGFLKGVEERSQLEPPGAPFSGPVLGFERGGDAEPAESVRRIDRRTVAAKVAAVAAPLLAQSAETQRRAALGDLAVGDTPDDWPAEDGPEPTVQLLDPSEWEGTYAAGYVTAVDYKLTCWLPDRWMNDIYATGRAMIGDHFVVRRDSADDRLVWALRLVESGGFHVFRVDRAWVNSGSRLEF